MNVVGYISFHNDSPLVSYDVLVMYLHAIVLLLDHVTLTRKEVVGPFLIRILPRPVTENLCWVW